MSGCVPYVPCRQQIADRRCSSPSLPPAQKIAESNLENLLSKLKVSNCHDIAELGVRYPKAAGGAITMNFTSAAQSIRLGWVTTQGWYSHGGAPSDSRNTIRVTCDGRYDIKIKKLSDGKYSYSITLDPQIAGVRIDLGTRTYLLSSDPREHHAVTRTASAPKARTRQTTDSSAPVLPPPPADMPPASDEAEQASTPRVSTIIPDTPLSHQQVSQGQQELASDRDALSAHHQALEERAEALKADRERLEQDLTTAEDPESESYQQALKELERVDADSRELVEDYNALQQETATLEQQYTTLERQAQLTYNRLTTDKALAEVALKAQTGTPQQPDTLRTTVSFSYLDPTTGQPLSNNALEADVVGDRLYIDSLIVKFDDTLVESGQVSGHPTRFFRLYGSEQAPILGTPILDPDNQPAGAKEEQLFLASFTPEGKAPDWQTFWTFTEVSSLLRKYEENREAFWQNFLRFADKDVFWDLAEDQERMEKLGVSNIQGTALSINLSPTEQEAPIIGSRYRVFRRNLGGLELRPPEIDDQSKSD